QLVVTSLPDRFRVCATQNINNMIQAEPESAFGVHAINAGKKLLRVDGSVERFARLQAVIASVTALFAKFFGEILQQHGAPALAGLSVMHHLPELCASDASFVFAL